MIAADAIVKCLEKEGVEYVFGYPGVAICPFFNSILDTNIKTILVRQEQNAAHEASGYARITGKVGVAVATSGPGATNLITGIATAFADSIPLVCITGQVDSNLMGSDVFQEVDVSGACESFVKFSYIVRRAADIPRIIKEAFHIAGTGRKGPVLIDIPIDIQKAEIRKFEYPETVNIRTYKPTINGHAVQIKKVIKELNKAKRPIICAGGGVHLSGAKEELRKFVEANDIPVVSTMMGLGALPTEHFLFYGMVGNNGQAYGNRAMNDADMIIMVGARVADRSVSQPDLITENKVLVHIDVDPAEIGKNAGPTIPLVGDIKHVLEEFNKATITADYSLWIDKLDGYKDDTQNASRRKRHMYSSTLTEEEINALTVNPEIFVKRLSRAMKKDAVYVADVGQNQLWSCANCVIREGRFLTSGGMGTMGYSVPAALGAKLGAPDRQVVAVCGDGGFQMTMMELATMKQYNVPVKIVVLRNNVLGLVRQYQHFTYQDRFSVIDLGDSIPDFRKLAEAYGIRYQQIAAVEEMDSGIEEFLADDEATLLEVIVDPKLVV
ncbi:MAG: biosynthetic-type acetolactate synthase large subunit [Lachnospiraceae bacterium]|jgi:acetolactate synthase-1/2/3 large subunit|nr:biosynthetic-type acetolactate synthase large subunit [Lachnospiraceae bacterium]